MKILIELKRKFEEKEFKIWAKKEFKICGKRVLKNLRKKEIKIFEKRKYFMKLREKGEAWEKKGGKSSFSGKVDK